MALALVFSSATIWSSECRTSSRLPRASKTTQTMSTLAMLTAAFRQKFCHALLKAKSMRFQSRCMVPSCILVSDNLAAIDRHHPATHDIDDLSVVGRHHDRGAAGIDLQQKLDDLPRRARAIATRCCSPPESWSGYLFSFPSSPTMLRTSSTFGLR